MMLQSNSPRAAARVDDAALVRAVRDGDRRAATAIVERYTPLVRRWVGPSFSGADLDDQVQEVFLRLFEHLPRLRKPEALRSYLIGIALRSAAIQRRRLRTRHWERLTVSGELPERAESQPPIEMHQVAARTRALLGRLRPQSWRVLELRFIEERELLDVAEGLGVSRATAQRKLVQATACVRALVRSEPVVAEYVGSRRAAMASHPRREISP